MLERKNVLIKRVYLLTLCCICLIFLVSCTGKKTENETTINESTNNEKEDVSSTGDIEFANDENSDVSRIILSSLLGENSSADEILYNLNLATSIDKYIVRFEILDNEVIDSKGRIKKLIDEDAQVIVSASIGKKVRYYKFNVLSKKNSAKKMLDIYSEELLHNTSDIRDNITFIDKTGINDEIIVSWELKNAEDDNIITMSSTGENNEIPAGVITRGETDKKVTVIAHLSVDVDGEEFTKDKEFELNIKAKPEKKTYSTYVYTYFRGNIYGNGESQHIHMAVSKDGYFWNSINDNEPVLKAEKGTKGVRDSFLIRSPYGDKFYLIGTDLDANGGDWAAYANKGSKAIRVWESTDLVNWSEERLIDIAPKGAGCMWAPECHYDSSTGEYVVYFSTGIVGGNGKKIFYVKTRDFYNFTEAKIFKDVEGKTTFIDTSITEYNGTYYRFTKNENEITILVEKSDSLLGEYSLIKTRIANQWGVEGPGIYKINGEEKWCLYMDGYANENAGVGYFPLIAESEEDLKNGNFRKLEDDEYEMPKGAKHGSFVPITEEEYNALVEKWGI